MMETIYTRIKQKYGWNTYIQTNSAMNGEFMVAYDMKGRHIFYTKSKNGFERLVEYDEEGKIAHYEYTGMYINKNDDKLHLSCNYDYTIAIDKENNKNELL